jgi:protein involved in polysaccharide export with SLBB domain
VSLAILAGPAAAQTPAYPQPPAQAAPAAFDPWVDEDYRYRIGAGDEVALKFLVNPDIDGPVTVGPDGRGVFPLIGSYRLEGLTADQASQALTEAYRTVLRNPQVQVLITSYGSAAIYVGGEVKEAGVKPIKGRVSMTQAIMAAGGFADTARTDKVVVLRQRPGEPRPQMRVVDVRLLLRGGDGGDVMLSPGDVVFVPRSGVADADVFMRQHFTDLIPFGFSYGLSLNGR